MYSNHTSSAASFVQTQPLASVSSSSNHAQVNGTLIMVLDLLKEELVEEWFSAPVDPVALNIPTYLEIIKNPMDLGTVRDRLASNQYPSENVAISDIRLTFQNAMRFNPPQNAVHAVAKRVLNKFERKCSLVLKARARGIEYREQQPSSMSRETKDLLSSNGSSPSLPLGKRRRTAAAHEADGSSVEPSALSPAPQKQKDPSTEKKQRVSSPATAGKFAPSRAGKSQGGKGKSSKGGKAGGVGTAVTPARPPAIQIPPITSYPMAVPDFPSPGKGPSNLDLEACRRVFESIRDHDCSGPFLEPVDPVALEIPDYLSVVKNPMDLGTVGKRLNSGYYKSNAQFAHDMQLIWDNCILFNGPDKGVSRMARQLQQKFEVLSKKFGIL